jgi:signal transduction histidine kinase
VLIAAMAAWTHRRRKTHSEAHGSPFGKDPTRRSLRDLGRRLLKAQEEERTRIALELHDDVSQQAVALAIDLQRINDLRPPRSEDRARRAKAGEESVESVHDLSHRLHPANLRLIGLLGALGQLQRDLLAPGVVITWRQRTSLPSCPTILRCVCTGLRRKGCRMRSSTAGVAISKFS